MLVCLYVKMIWVDIFFISSTIQSQDCSFKINKKFTSCGSLVFVFGAQVLICMSS